MKARDYAGKYRADPSTNKEAEIAALFTYEMAAQVVQRNCTTNRACLAVVKEFQDKWKVFQKLTGIVRDFQFVLKFFMPEFYAELQRGPGVFNELGWK